MTDQRPAPRIEVTITPASQGSKILIDDVEVPNVRAMIITAGVGQTSRVTLELVAAEVIVKGAVHDVTKLSSTIREFRSGGEPDDPPRRMPDV